MIKPIFLMLLIGGSLTQIWANVAYANITDNRAATWNLQGASHGTENKWQANVRQLLRGQAVVAIQEAGSVPSSAELTNRVIASPQGSTLQVQEYTWRLGSHSRPGQLRYIYYVNMQNRLSLATITDRPADEVIVLPNPIDPQGRPMLGVGFNRSTGSGRDYFFNLHARATGVNNEAPAMVNAIYQYFATQPARNNDQWLIMGDFNMPPSSLRNLLDANYPASILRDSYILTQNSSTQISGGTLDYAVAGQVGSAGTLQNSLTAVLFVAQLQGQLASDHTPVAFFAKDK